VLKEPKEGFRLAKHLSLLDRCGDLPEQQSMVSGAVVNDALRISGGIMQQPDNHMQMCGSFHTQQRVAAELLRRS
jgi:hypothetical protein